jgi:hypothetical protein
MVICSGNLRDFRDIVALVFIRGNKSKASLYFIEKKTPVVCAHNAML